MWECFVVCREALYLKFSQRNTWRDWVAWAEFWRQQTIALTCSSILNWMCITCLLFMAMWLRDIYLNYIINNLKNYYIITLSLLIYMAYMMIKNGRSLCMYGHVNMEVHVLVYICGMWHSEVDILYHFLTTLHHTFWNRVFYWIQSSLFWPHWLAKESRGSAYVSASYPKPTLGL